MRTQTFVVAVMLAVANLAHAEMQDPAQGSSKVEAEKAALHRAQHQDSGDRQNSGGGQRSGLENMRGASAAPRASSPAGSYMSHSASRSVHGIR